MRFLLDECVDVRLGTHLQNLGHDVTRMVSDYPGGMEDAGILVLARQENRIILTDDLDFGELVFRLRYAHAGVILMRLDSDRVTLPDKIRRLDTVLNEHAGDLSEFIVVTEQQIRVRRRDGTVRM